MPHDRLFQSLPTIQRNSASHKIPPFDCSLIETFPNYRILSAYGMAVRTPGVCKVSLNRVCHVRRFHGGSSGFARWNPISPGVTCGLTCSGTWSIALSVWPFRRRGLSVVITLAQTWLGSPWVQLPVPHNAWTYTPAGVALLFDDRFFLLLVSPLAAHQSVPVGAAQIPPQRNVPQCHQPPIVSTGWKAPC